MGLRYKGNTRHGCNWSWSFYRVGHCPCEMKQGAAWCGVVPALEAVKSGEYVDVDAGGERGMRCEEVPL